MSGNLEAELAAVAAEGVLTALPDVANVYRRVRARDAFGGATESYDDTDPLPMACRLGYKPTSQMMVMGGRLEAITDDVHVTYPENARLSIGDRLLVRGRWFEMQTVQDFNTLGIFNEGYAKQITPAPGTRDFLEVLWDSGEPILWDSGEPIDWDD